IPQIGPQALADSLLHQRHRVRRAVPGWQAARAVVQGRFVELFEDVQDDQSGVVALRDGDCALEGAIATRAEVSGQEDFPRGARNLVWCVHVRLPTMYATAGEDP